MHFIDLILLQVNNIPTSFVCVRAMKPTRIEKIFHNWNERTLTNKWISQLIIAAIHCFLYPLRSGESIHIFLDSIPNTLSALH